jgi:hypothetical protein
MATQMNKTWLMYWWAVYTKSSKGAKEDWMFSLVGARPTRLLRGPKLSYRPEDGGRKEIREI